MNVIKRDGSIQAISFDKILNRIKYIGIAHNIQNINYEKIAISIIEQLHNNITTSKLDELAAEYCASLITLNTDYKKFASAICISNHQKNTKASFSEVMNELYYYINPYNETHKPLINESFWKFVNLHATYLNNLIDYQRDFNIDFFGFKTLEKSYLIKINSIPVERPQHMWLRVAIAIHMPYDFDTDNMLSTLDRLTLIKNTYDLLSFKMFIHATPTLFNAGTNHQQLSSCFLLANEDDSLEGIFNTLKDTALISKHAGGIGIHIHNVRAKGSHIQGTNGVSNGIIPMLRVYNNTARYVDQGGGKRSGSFAIYLEPWHADISSFLTIKKNHGDEETKARDLFTALWIPDLFMERVRENGGKWSLFCPNQCPGLSDVYGDNFKELYEQYEKDGKAIKTIIARDLWLEILDSQMETGTPYLLYKDAANKKSNQQNLGTIKSSNLCCEIIEYSDSNETSVCNLGSIALPMFVCEQTKTFKYEELHKIVKVLTYNLNRIIDINYYPTNKTKTSNLSHRPIGIGVQGLADVFMLLDIPFYSDEAKNINKCIFETIYHAALEQSNELSKQIYNFKKNKDDSSDVSTFVGTYSSFEGSPASKGILQFDLWGVNPGNTRYNWDEMKTKITTYGLRNSLLVAPMPTASTSQILGFNECFEPITSNIYSRNTKAGEFSIVNKYLQKELIDLNLWNQELKDDIISHKGSIQHLTQLSQHMRDKYKIAWEIPMKHIIDMSADRGAYICQSQSLNLWMEEPTYNKLTSMHFYSWSKGLKTGIYYLRRKSKQQAQQFTIEPTANVVCSIKKNSDKDEVCEMCSA